MKFVKYITSVFHKIKIHYLKSKYKDKNSILLKWGIIGTGYMSNVFANTIEISKSSKLISVCSRNENTLNSFRKRHLFSNGYTDRKLFYNDDIIDIIYIATPIQTHFSIIKECIQLEYDVLCEKPIVSNINELTELLDLLAQKKNRVFEAMWVRCLPTVNKVKAIIENNEMGKIQQIDVKLCKNDKNKNQSVMFNYGVYCINLVTYLVKDELKILDCNIKYMNDNDVTWNISLVSKQIKINIEISSMYDSNNSATFLFEEGLMELPNQFNRTNNIIIKSKNGRIKKLRYKYINYGFEYELNEVEQYYTGEYEKSCLDIDYSYKNYKLINDLYKFKIT